MVILAPDQVEGRLQAEIHVFFLLSNK